MTTNRSLSLAFFLLASIAANAAAIPGKLSGTITVATALAGKVSTTDTLYIIARSQPAGPPTAVKRIENPHFPLKYVLGPEDAMMPGAHGFEKGGTLVVVARLSKSGNAIAASGDLEGAFAKNPAHPGAGGVDVKIDHVR